MKGFKRSVIKEELLMLTGDYKLAIMLNQMIYWSQCVRDFDKFIAEEKKRNEDYELELTHGWFYKTANELAQDTLTAMAPSSIRRYLKKLLEAGWVEERGNPKIKWDRTKQYRVNLVKIQQDLNRIGLYLEGYKTDIPVPAEELDLDYQPQSTVNEQADTNEQTSFFEEDQAPEAEDQVEPTPKKIPYSEIIAYLNDSTGK
ncbi:helix-turn-helix domain-containing protein [Salipaludibacillus neizhouensis]|uniref:hypothetical protein n=1 Tax=Salipaludibacillus neizhouensis TaxID=885475 RepID=UPI001CBA6A35|nr:hypothetical protein [Salipaludibacillus neizhouensis]